MKAVAIGIELYYLVGVPSGRGIFWGKIKMPRFQFARLVLVTTLLTLLKSVRQPQRSFAVAVFLLLGVAGLVQAQTSPTTTVVTSSATAASDPGVRGGAPGAGGFIAGLTDRQKEFFFAGQTEFKAVEVVTGGLGPRMNLDSCAGCHA